LRASRPRSRTFGSLRGKQNQAGSFSPPSAAKFVRTIFNIEHIVFCLWGYRGENNYLTYISKKLIFKIEGVREIFSKGQTELNEGGQKQLPG